MKLLPCFRSVTTDPAYSIKPNCVIVEAPLLKDGNGKELRCVHDILVQHLQVLKVMDYEPGPFVTSLIEMRLDQATAFEWQRHIQGTTKVPYHS